MEKRNKATGFFRAEIFSIIIPNMILFVAMMLTSRGFLTAYNVLSLLQSLAIYIIIGLAQMCALSLGQFNLSVGSTGALSAIIMGFCYQQLHMPLLPGLLVGLLIAASAGLLQGELIARTKLNPFIVSLSLMSIYTGLANIICRGYSFAVPQGIIVFNRTKILGVVPVSLLLSLIVTAVVYVFFRYLRPGKELVAVGASKRSALFSGINCERTIVLGHCLSGLLCGIAAFIQVARFGSAQSTVGDDWMMTSFAVAVLGGTLLSGGKVSTLGTLFGSILMVLLSNALVLWGFSSYTFQFILGIVLIIAYELDRARQTIIKRQSELNVEIPRQTAKETRNMV